MRNEREKVRSGATLKVCCRAHERIHYMHIYKRRACAEIRKTVLPSRRYATCPAARAILMESRRFVPFFPARCRLIFIGEFLSRGSGWGFVGFAYRAWSASIICELRFGMYPIFLERIVGFREAYNRGAWLRTNI